MTTYSHKLYQWSGQWLSILERRHQRDQHDPGRDDDFDVILFGLGRFGSHLAERLTGAGHRVLGVDFDPHGVTTHRRKGVETTFGSAEDLALLEALPLDRAKYVISAIPALQTNLALLLNQSLACRCWCSMALRHCSCLLTPSVPGRSSTWGPGSCPFPSGPFPRTRTPIGPSGR